MHLQKLIVSGFKNISNSAPQSITIDPKVTALIGYNGSGKSTLLEALSKLFSIDPTLRKISHKDFHCSHKEHVNSNRELFIDAWFSFEKDKHNDPSVPTLIEQFVLDQDNKIIFRIRLEASISYDASPLGDIEENIYIICSAQSTPSAEDKIRLNASIRNSIQVHYIPATRDPLKQLSYSSKAILGRFLRSINWSQQELDSFSTTSKKLSTIANENPALTEISNAINSGWGVLYKEKYIKNIKLDFPLDNIDDIIRLTELYFTPDEHGLDVKTESLSDGQKSLLYFTMINSILILESKIKNSLIKGKELNFDSEKIKLPIYSLIALEEPENHLSPHYLGRIISLLSKYAEHDGCQLVFSTHSPSVINRVEPLQIRHFKSINGCCYINELALPKKTDEAAKYISEAVKAYPEIYFAKLVILVEGDSEQAVIPKILSVFNRDIDGSSISIAPLGGKHVNHFWRLLESIDANYITLLDFDLDRNGGGYERITNAITQLGKLKEVEYIYSDICKQIPKWDDVSIPLDFTIEYEGDEIVNIISKLEENNIFFSYPLDLDYSMIKAFPEIYCAIDESNNENGPQHSDSPSDIKDILINSVLKEGNKGSPHYISDDNYLKYFLWYRFRFLGNKSKPASHIRLINKIAGNDLLNKMPQELKRLAAKVQTLLETI